MCGPQPILPDAIPHRSSDESGLPPPHPSIAAMPLHAERPIVRVEHGSMRTIETRNVENLHGLWTGKSCRCPFFDRASFTRSPRLLIQRR